MEARHDHAYYTILDSDRLCGCKLIVLSRLIRIHFRFQRQPTHFSVLRNTLTHYLDSLIGEIRRYTYVGHLRPPLPKGLFDNPFLAEDSEDVHSLLTKTHQLIWRRTISIKDHFQSTDVKPSETWSRQSSLLVHFASAFDLRLVTATHLFLLPFSPFSRREALFSRHHLYQVARRIACEFAPLEFAEAE
jgi:hypothetical protein